MKPTRAEIVNATIALCRNGWVSGTAADFQTALMAGCQWQWFAAGAAISYGGDTSCGMVGIVRGAFSATPAVGASDAPVRHIGGALFWYSTNPLLDGMARTVVVITRSRCLVARAVNRRRSGTS